MVNLNNSGRGKNFFYTSSSSSQHSKVGQSPEQFRKSRSSKVRSYSTVGERGNRNRTKSRQSRFLLSSVCCAKTKQSLAPCHRLKCVKHIHKCASFSHGDNTGCETIYKTGRVCSFTRFDRCVPAHSDPQSFKKISQIRHGRNCLSVQSPSVRTKFKPVDFYTCNGGCDFRGEKRNNFRNFSLFGRCDAKEYDRKRFVFRPTFSNSTSAASRISHKYRKIRLGTVERFYSFGNAFSNRGKQSDADRKKNREDNFSCTEFSLAKDLHTKTDRKTNRSILVCSRATSARKIETSVPSICVCRHLGSKSGLGHESYYKQRSPSSDQCVARRTVVKERSNSCVCTTNLDVVYRCVHGGLGRTPRAVLYTNGVKDRKTGARSMDDRRQTCLSAYQRTRTSRSDASCVCIEKCSYGPVCPPNVGQHYGSSIHQESRGHSFKDSVQPHCINSSILCRNKHAHCCETYSRTSESDSRQFVTTSQTNRMETPPRDISQSPPALSFYGSGSVCDQVQSSAGEVCVAISRQSSGDDRRSVSRLEPERPVRLSSFPSGSKDSSTSPFVFLQNDINSSPQVESLMDNAPTSTVHRNSKEITAQKGLTNPRAGSGSPGSTESEPTCFQTVRREALCKRKFRGEVVDRMLNARRPSTLKVYDSKWAFFIKWCKTQKLKPLELSTYELAEFLLHLFEIKKLAPITIKGYRSAIAHVYRLAGKEDPGRNMDLSLLVDNFTLERPQVRKLFPKWSLDIVLEFLKSDIFSDLESISLRRLLQKTIFLVSLATAARVSEIHALSSDPDCIRFNQDGTISLLTAPGFIAKNRLPELGNQSFLLVPLQGETDFCPVKFLKIYWERTKDRDKGSPLFVSHKNGKSSPQFISTMISGLIKEAYQVAISSAPSSSQSMDTRNVSGLATDQTDFHSATDPGTSSQTDLQSGLEEESDNERAGKDGTCSSHDTNAQQVKDGNLPVLTRYPAHELRAVAASLAFHRGAALKDIIKAVGWSSASTFGRFYLRHLDSGQGRSVEENIRLPE